MYIFFSLFALLFPNNLPAMGEECYRIRSHRIHRDIPDTPEYERQWQIQGATSLDTLDGIARELESDSAKTTERYRTLIAEKPQRCSLAESFSFIHKNFQNMKDIEPAQRSTNRLKESVHNRRQQLCTSTYTHRTLPIITPLANNSKNNVRTKTINTTFHLPPIV